MRARFLRLRRRVTPVSSAEPGRTSTPPAAVPLAVTIGVALTEAPLPEVDETTVQSGSLVGSHVNVPSEFCVQLWSTFGSHVTVPVGVVTVWQFGSLFGSHVTVPSELTVQFGSLFGSHVTVGVGVEFPLLDPLFCVVQFWLLFPCLPPP